ncbi:MAG: leucine-rich repeat domain-containing protein [Rikenellaceae bacterium]
MKKILPILLLLLTVTTTTTQAKKEKEKKLSKKELIALNTTTMPIELIGANNYPTTSIWSIKGNTDNFEDLRDALEAASMENRTIELVLENVTMIPDEAFMNCQSLVTLSCPSASSVGRNAFANCRTLTTIALPVAGYIGESAFSACSTLTSLNLPSAMTIKGTAFIYCESLTSLELGTDGAGVSDLGQDSFDGFSTGSCDLTIKSGIVEVDEDEENILTVQGSATYTFSTISLQ